ncbi:hypothetical protein QBC37DRAFT_403645 [Rhypophila decipiens]|uniref:Uncharacterized protein n=1 Tax=Rhypophila decipiens TaxID=261697 RepID=A0AAN6Y192_9PEZI|nr:hypothetical protein QBC37DRAFT_403645 [Rhypophila decipiens]
MHTVAIDLAHVAVMRHVVREIGAYSATENSIPLSTNKSEHLPNSVLIRADSMAKNNPNPNEDPEIKLGPARLNLMLLDEKFDTLSNTAKKLNDDVEGTKSAVKTRNEDVEGTKSAVKTLNEDLKEAKRLLNRARSALDPKLPASGEATIAPSQQRVLQAIDQAALDLRDEMDRQEEIERQAGISGLGPDGGPLRVSKEGLMLSMSGKSKNKIICKVLRKRAASLYSPRMTSVLLLLHFSVVGLCRGGTKDSLPGHLYRNLMTALCRHVERVMDSRKPRPLAFVRIPTHNYLHLTKKPLLFINQKGAKDRSTMSTKAPNPPHYTSSGEEQRSNREPMSLSPMSIRSLEVSGSDDAEIEDASAQAQKNKTIDERVHLLLGMTSQMGDVLGGLTEVFTIIASGGRMTRRYCCGGSGRIHTGVGYVNQYPQPQEEEMTYTPTFADLLERDKTIAHLQDQIDQVRNNLTDLRAQVRQKQAQNKLDHTPTSRFTPRHGHTPNKTAEPTDTLSHTVSDLDENITILKLEVESLSRLASEKHWGFGVKSVGKRCPSCGTSLEDDEVKKQGDTDSDEDCYDWIIEDRDRYTTGFGTEKERSQRRREGIRKQRLKKEEKQKLKERLDENKELLEKEEAAEETELPEQKKNAQEKLLKKENTDNKEERRKKYTAVYTPPRGRGGKASLSFQLG